MLTLFRNMLRSKVALVIIGILIIAMASFGITDIFTPNLGSSLAAVGNRTVETRDLDREADFQLDRVNQNGGSYTRQDLAASGQLQGLIYQLVNRNVQASYLNRLGLSASERQVIDVVRQNDIFRSDIHGGFDRERYNRFLSQRGQTESQFTQWLNDDLTFMSLTGGLSSSIEPPNGLAELLTMFSEERRRIAYLVVQSIDLPDPVEPPTEDELRSFYDERIGMMLQPERRGFSVIAVRAEDFIHQVEITQEELENEYLAQQTRFSGPSERTFEQIVFSTEAAARQALGRLLGGESTEDVLAAINGQQLPSQTRTESEVTNPELSSAVFGSPRDVWAGPVFLNNGQWAVVRVTEEVAGEATPLEEVADVLRTEITEYKASRLFADSIDAIDDAVGSGGTLDEVAQMIGSPLYTFPPVDERGFTREGMRVGALIDIDGALDLGFQLYEDETSFREDGGDTQYIIRLDETVQSYLPEFEEMREELYAIVFEQKRQTVVSDYVGGMMQRINDGAFLNAEASALELTVERPPVALERTSGPQIGFPNEVMARIFGSSLDQPFSLPLQRGVFIGVVEAIEIPQGDDLASQRPATDSALTQVISSEFDQAVFDVARETVQPRLNDSAIATYLEQYQPIE